MPDSAELPLMIPDLQVAFYYRLQAVRERYLHEALASAISTLELPTVNRDLDACVPTPLLTQVASYGLRGEVFFPVPCVLTASPALLGYYRLLYGLSQKEFYAHGGYGRFKGMEERSVLSPALVDQLPALCRSLNRTAALLLEGLDALSLATIHDLQLLTLGAQFRGSRNTDIGSSATRTVFRLFQQWLAPCLRRSTENVLEVENASGRPVLIEFAGDPDIRITEVMDSMVRPLVSIEIKGGTDVSNIHNRLGEAEKSHQKARARGFFEFWTLVRVEIDYTYAKQESPTTSHFFHLDRIADATSPEGTQFRDLLASIIGVPAAPGDKNKICDC